jgi:hypothetical protein
LSVWQCHCRVKGLKFVQVMRAEAAKIANCMVLRTLVVMLVSY